MYIDKDMTPKDIADELGISFKTVYTLLRKYKISKHNSLEERKRDYGSYKINGRNKNKD